MRKSKRLALVADDSDTMRALLKKQLLQYEFTQFVEAVNAFEVKERLEEMMAEKKPLPDVVFLDQNMGGPTGLDCLEFIRQTPELQSLPVVFVTSEGESEKIIDAIALGASAYLTKPLNTHSLKHALDLIQQKSVTPDERDPVHSTLVLDHLFFIANDSEFEEIKTIFQKFECASHQNVVAGEDSWEGVYIKTRGNNYLEILRGPNRSLGLCQKTCYPFGVDARHIVKDFPQLPWKKFERTADGQRWFTALSTVDYENLATPFNTWVMHYYQRDMKKLPEIKRFEIERIFEMHFSAHSSLLETIKAGSAWFHGKREFKENEIVFDLQTHFSDSFLLRISLDATEPGIHFRKSVMKMHPDFPALGQNLQHFRFVSEGEFQILEKKAK